MTTRFFIDLDGTLTDISARHYGVYVECIEELNGTPINKEHYWKLKRADTKWDIILPLSKLDPDLEHVFLQKFTDKIETIEWLKIDQLLRGSRDTLELLSRQYLLVLVSLRRNREELLAQLKHLEIDNYFEAILSGHSETKRGTLLKKAEVIRDFGYSKESIIVGDTEADLAAGTQLGITSFAVLTGIRDRGFLQKHNPNYILSSFSELQQRL